MNYKETKGRKGKDFLPIILNPETFKDLSLCSWLLILLPNQVVWSSDIQPGWLSADLGS